jgi:phosphatidylserine/phosphatidylglycerophosphate/cardiolipin synthase-like enzyme
MFVDRAFGTGSPSNTPYPHLTVLPQDAREAIHLDSYFAPEDAVADKVLDLVRGAQQSIRFLAFSFTDDRLGEAIQAKARDGLVVQGVFETRGSETEYSEYGRLASASPPLDVWLDGNPYLMHHKVIILDDAIVVLGSFNFTESANTANDENLLVIHDASVATAYRAEFERVYRQAGSGR